MGKQFKKRDFSEKEYIPRDWIDKEAPLTFTFKPMSNMELAHTDDLYNKYDLERQEIVSALNSVDYRVGKEQLIGWKNLIVDGEEVEFNVLLLDSINIVDEIVELGKYIYVISKDPDLEMTF